MCKACKKGTEEIAGCVLLLQLWAWTRLPTLAPVSRGPYVDNGDIWGDLPGPFGLRWCAPKSYANSSSHVVYIDRLSLDVLVPDHFIWLPYADVLDKLSNICQEGSEIWCYKGPIICFHIIEPHEPDRCLRQFNIVQDIPSPPTIYSTDLHKMNLKGKTEIDWRDKHKEHILLWNNRLQSVNPIGNIGLGITDDYADWYANITCPYHTRVAAAQSHLFNILNHISSIASRVVSGDYNTIDIISKHGRRVLESQYSRGLRLDFSADDTLIDKEPVEVKLKRVGHKGGRGEVNATKKCRIHTDDVRNDNINDARCVHLKETAASIEHHVEVHEMDNRGIDRTPMSWFPNFDLIPDWSSWFPNFDLIPDWSQSREETTYVYPTPLPHPTSNLLSTVPLVQDDQQITRMLTNEKEDNRVEPMHVHPSFNLSCPEDFQPLVHEEQIIEQPPSVDNEHMHELIEQQLPAVEKQQPPPIEEQQPRPVEIEQPLPIQQENFPVDQQPQEEKEEWPPIPEEHQHLEHEHAIQLRPRKKKGPKCETDGY
ncbi:hypothetical protein AgCh_017364 [Apium graveolens]